MTFPFFLNTETWAGRACLLAAVSALAVSAGILTAPHSASAQNLDFFNSEAPSVDEDLLLEANNLTYDFDRDIITARGDVQVYYDGNTVQAAQIVFNRGTQQLTATGNVIFLDTEGNILRTEELQMSEDFAQAFARSLQIDMPNRTRLIAEQATREDGNVTVVENGVYTVYTNPTRPAGKAPLWRIRSKTIVHDKQEKVIRFEQPSLEFYGQPVLYAPFLSMPDPTVKRHSGFLIPNWVIADKLGFGANIPYYWALSPHRDLTTTFTPLTRQGLFVDVDFRQKFRRGDFSLSAGGIYQLDPDQFKTQRADSDMRGAFRTTGTFNVTGAWNLGWDVTYKSDRAFFEDYSFTSWGGNETSRIYFEGLTERNALSFNTYGFQIAQADYTSSNFNADGFSPVGSNLQSKQPLVLPVVDYDFVFADPVLDGELSLAANFTSLTREETDAFSIDGGTNARFRGVDGTFSRLSVDGTWRRTFVDPLGQTFTPFAYMKGDLFFLASPDADVTALAGESFVGRAMPAIGLEYSYPIIASFNGGNQIFEPIAQIIARPNEQRIGELPNEDAQSIVFDTTTLFDTDKFSGFDRAEGGTRLNVGLNYKLQLNSGHYLTGLFGRSYHLAGENSYKVPDILGATQDSGLESDLSDYVGSLYLDTKYGVKLGTQARFDKDDFSINRLQAQASAIYGPVVSSVAYAFLDAQPNVGIDDTREELLGSASLRLQENWRVFGSMRYDLQNSNIVQDGVGVGYDDEGFSLSLSYSEDRSRNDGDTTDRLLFFRVGLRTLGNTQIQSNAINN